MLISKNLVTIRETPYQVKYLMNFLEENVYFLLTCFQLLGLKSDLVYDILVLITPLYLSKVHFLDFFEVTLDNGLKSSFACKIK